MPSKRQGPRARGLDAAQIVAQAVSSLEEDASAELSLRKLGKRVGCDPMAILYHFRSKVGLERAMAEFLNAQLRPVDRAAPWRWRMADLAGQYRELARRFPHTFPLLQRFWITGVADYAHAEMIYEALVDAGFARDELVPICFGWYAAVLGLASAEAGGLLTPAGPEQLAEVGALDPEAFPITTSLLGEFERQTRDAAYDRAVAMLLDGLEAQCAGRAG